jgi:hypothetical protein
VTPLVVSVIVMLVRRFCRTRDPQRELPSGGGSQTGTFEVPRRLTKKTGAAMPPSAEDVCYGAGNRVIEKVPLVTVAMTLFVVSVSTTFDQVML